MVLVHVLTSTELLNTIFHIFPQASASARVYTYLCNHNRTFQNLDAKSRKGRGIGWD